MQDNHPSLVELEQRGDFIRRHVGPDESQIAEMLRLLGLTSLEAIIDQGLPASILASAPLDLPPPMSERAVLTQMRQRRER